MKRLPLFLAVVLALFLLSGCASSNPVDVESTADPGAAAEPDITSDPAITAPEETEPIEIEVHIGDSLLAAGVSLENVIVEYENAVIWRDSKGYHVACAGEDGDTINAIVWFSEDLELLEADGLEPIDPPQMEEWLGKTEEDFIAQYGPFHFQPGPNRTSPASIDKDGNVYWMEVENGTIVLMYSYSIDGRHYSNYNITDPKETDFAYEVPVGSSLRTVRKSLEDRIVFEFNAFVVWRDSKGYHIACTGDDWDRIYAIVSFSEDLELLEAEGLEPIDPPQTEEWLGKTEKEFIAQYGPYHFQSGSGSYMPWYIAKDGNLYRLSVYDDTIGRIYSISIDGHHTTVYEIDP